MRLRSHKDSENDTRRSKNDSHQLTGVSKRGKPGRKNLKELQIHQIDEACSSYEIAIKIGPKSSKTKSRSKPLEKETDDQSEKSLVIDCVISERAEKKPKIQTQFDPQLPINVSSKNDCLSGKSEHSENPLPKQTIRSTRSADRSKTSLVLVPEQCKQIEKESMFQVELSSDPAIVSTAKPQTSNDESKKYSLRSLTKRSEKSDQGTGIICEKTEIKEKVITPIQRAGIYWETLIKNNYEISVGSIVLAKMNTFWPWPAQIIRFNKSKAHIRFFGDLTTGSVTKRNCVPYQKCSLVIHFYLEAIPLHLRFEYMKLLHKEYNVDARSNYTMKMNLRAKFMQAVDDIGLYLELKTSFLEGFLKKL